MAGRGKAMTEAATVVVFVELYLFYYDSECLNSTSFTIYYDSECDTVTPTSFPSSLSTVVEYVW